MNRLTAVAPLSRFVRHKLPTLPGWGSILAQAYCQNSQHISCIVSPQEDARHAAEVAANTLISVHRDSLTKFWDERLLRGTHHEKTQLVSFLLKLHHYFPDWPLPSWESIKESMLEDDYVSAAGNDSEDILAHMVSFCFALSLYVQLSSDLQDRPVNENTDVHLLRVSTSALTTHT